MRLNTTLERTPIFTHEGGRATPASKLQELRRSVLTCMLWENSFYEKGSAVAERIEALVPEVPAQAVAALAVEARDKMGLRHVPLFLLGELSKVKGNGRVVEIALTHCIQRADELAEFLAIYWRKGKHPIAAACKRALAAAFTKFSAYQLAKYNRDAAVKLRDVLFLCHAKPTTEEQAVLWKQLVDGTLASPDTWEVELSAGKDKRETFERLMREEKLGGLAVLRNLRGMLDAGVDEELIRARLGAGIKRAFPYRFVVAAKHAPRIEDAIEHAMLKAVEDVPGLPGHTGLLIDVSGSMDYVLNPKNESRTTYMPCNVAGATETSRIDVAAGLAILLREKAERVEVATFSHHVVGVPPRRGFALRDAIKNSQPHASTHLRAALEYLQPTWKDFDRVIVITDEQSQDGVAQAYSARPYIINVASNAHGVGYRNGWQHIDGWSDQILTYIQALETEVAV